MEFYSIKLVYMHIYIHIYILFSCTMMCMAPQRNWSWLGTYEIVNHNILIIGCVKELKYYSCVTSIITDI